jgi:hypothetical protein
MFSCGSLRLAHKWTAPPSLNMDNVKQAITVNLAPIYFTIRSDTVAGPWNTDKNFYGIICSPKFEGMTRDEMRATVLNILRPLNLDSHCRFTLEPPSRWTRLYRKKRWRWGIDA